MSNRVNNLHRIVHLSRGMGWDHHATLRGAAAVAAAAAVNIRTSGAGGASNEWGVLNAEDDAGEALERSVGELEPGESLGAAWRGRACGTASVLAPRAS